ncbi:MAG: hypothetical protein MUF64_04620 [Polyangiaceae bacterium]|nr:hypothetical protein [Polyangiaceae bacterium]
MPSFSARVLRMSFSASAISSSAKATAAVRTKAASAASVRALRRKQRSSRRFSWPCWARASEKRSIMASMAAERIMPPVSSRRAPRRTMRSLSEMVPSAAIMRNMASATASKKALASSSPSRGCSRVPGPGAAMDLGAPVSRRWSRSRTRVLEGNPRIIERRG